MPDLTYSAQVSPEGLPGRAYPHVPESVPGGAFAGEDIGRGVEQVGAVVEQHEKAVQNQVRESQLMDFQNQAETLARNTLRDPQTGYLNLRGKAAIAGGGPAVDQFSSGISDLMDKLPNDPHLRLAAQRYVNQTTNQVQSVVDNHTMQQTQQFGVGTATDGLKLSAQSFADNYHDPTIMAAKEQDAERYLGSLANLQGWSKEEYDQHKHEFFSGMYTDTVERMIGENNDKTAGHFLKAHKDDLDAHVYEGLSSKIQAKAKQQLAEQRQDITDRYQDSWRASEFGLSNPITVSRAETNLLKDGARKWDMLQMVQAAGAKGKEYDQMTPDQVRADLETHRPTQGGPLATGAISSYEMLDRAANRSLSARADDSARFVIDAGLGWKPLNLQDSQATMTQLNSRANTAAEVSKQIGAPLNLLTKQEAAQFANVFTRQSPEQQLGVLGGLRSSLPDEAYEEVLHQIAPAHPVIALAGMMVARPNRASTPAWFNPKFAADPQVGSQILAGEQLLSGKGEEKAGQANESVVAKSGFAMPPEAELYNQFVKSSGGTSSNLFGGKGTSAELYYLAYKDYYAAEVEKSGNVSGKYVDAAGKKAGDAVFNGEPIQYGRSTLVVPHGMDPLQFEGHLDRAIKGALQDAGYGAKEQELIKNYEVKELGGVLGSGRYRIVTPQGTTFGTPDRSKPIIIDLNNRASGEIQR